jgi:hypothetical protein
MFYHYKEEDKMKNTKYRVWDKETGRMYYEAEKAYDWMGGEPSIPATSFNELLDDGCFEIMQYINRNDKNGKETYEGDFVRYRFPMTVSDQIREVVFSSKYCAFVLSETNFMPKSEEYVIVGNKFEHADL